MANTKSAIKTIRRITRQTKVNKNRKARYKNALKKMNSIIDKKNKKDALAYLPKLNSELMKISKTGIIKKKTRQEIFQELQKKLIQSKIFNFNQLQVV